VRLPGRGFEVRERVGWVVGVRDEEVVVLRRVRRLGGGNWGRCGAVDAHEMGGQVRRAWDVGGYEGDQEEVGG